MRAVNAKGSADQEPLVIINKQDQVLGCDPGSAGYPWIPSNITGWKIWWNQWDAEKYAEMFNKVGNTTYTALSGPFRVITLQQALED